MLKKRRKKNSKADVTIWNVFYFNPALNKETDQLKKGLIKVLRELNPIEYEFEELTAFLILRIHLNLEKTIVKIGIQEDKENSRKLSLLMKVVKEKLVKKYSNYREKITTGFLKNIKKNKELIEATTILTQKMNLNETDSKCFAENIYEKLEAKIKIYNEVMLNSIIFLGNSEKEGLASIIINSKEIILQSNEPNIQILDELILYNFSNEYSTRTKKILKEFQIELKKLNKQIRNINEKSKDIDDLFDLLKGKSFEILDNIYDIRRQVARQKRAERQILEELKEIGDEDLSKSLQEFSSEKDITSITKSTDVIIKEFDKWFDYIREIELLDVKEGVNIKLSENLTTLICEFFINMELIRNWSEFFYDISYFTVKKGRVLDSPDEHAKETIDTKAVLVAEDVYKTYRLPKYRVYALRGVSLEIYAGEFLAIMGPSGAGKTTLSNILTGLDSPDKGAVYLNGKNLALFDDKEKTEFRRDEIGLVFQFYQLFPELTALENVSIPAEMAGVPVNEAREKAQEILEIVDLGSFSNQYPDKLSGGQQQRVAIARALMNDPSIIVADQLTGDLDSVTGMQIIGYLRKINKEKGTTVLLVTHNKTVATQADRILTIEDGALIEEVDMKALRESESKENE